MKAIRIRLAGSIVLACLCLASSTAFGQTPITRDGPKVKAAFSDVVAKPSEVTCRVRCDGKDVVLGTIVGADGWIVTKASELKPGAIICRLKDGKELEATIIGQDERFDLALLKVEAKNLQVAQFCDSNICKAGRWVASAGTGGEPVAIGVVSVGTRDVTGRGSAPAPSPTSGYLGVALDLDFAGVKVNQVLPDTAASKAGIKAADQVLAVNGQAVANSDDFMGLLQRMKPGDEVTLKVVRDKNEMEIKATLGKRTGRTKGDLQNSWGSTLSERRTGFPTILQHDSVLKPTDCGGPLVDLEGRIVGINIARAGRVESYAIPSEVVQKLLPDLKAGKGAPKKEEPKKESSGNGTLTSSATIGRGN